MMDDTKEVELTPPVVQLLRYFEYDHLPPDSPQREMSAKFHQLAHTVLTNKPDLERQEVVAGLRKLLEAKDCFVRAALPVGTPLIP